jgi:hypothetical protein
MCVGDPFNDSWANPMLIRGVPKDQKQFNETAYTRKPLFIEQPERPFYTKPGGNRSAVHPNGIFDVIAAAEYTGGSAQRHLGISVRFGVPDNADTRMPVLMGNTSRLNTNTTVPLSPLRAGTKVPTRPRLESLSLNVLILLFQSRSFFSCFFSQGQNL